MKETLFASISNACISSEALGRDGEKSNSTFCSEEKVVSFLFAFVWMHSLHLTTQFQVINKPEILTGTRRVRKQVSLKLQVSDTARVNKGKFVIKKS